MTTLGGSGRVEAIATGVLEVDEDIEHVTDHLTRYQGTKFVPGQRLRVNPNDPAVMELVRADQLQIISDLPRPECRPSR